MKKKLWKIWENQWKIVENLGKSGYPPISQVFMEFGYFEDLDDIWLQLLPIIKSMWRISIKPRR